MWGKWKQDLAEIKGVTEYRDFLIKIITQRIYEITSKELDPNSFGSPSWPYLQASQVGARKELSNLLLTLDPEE